MSLFLFRLSFVFPVALRLSEGWEAFAQRCKLKSPKNSFERHVIAFEFHFLRIRGICLIWMESIVQIRICLKWYYINLTQIANKLHIRGKFDEFNWNNRIPLFTVQIKITANLVVFTFQPPSIPFPETDIHFSLHQDQVKAVNYSILRRLRTHISCLVVDVYWFDMNVVRLPNQILAPQRPLLAVYRSSHHNLIEIDQISHESA